MFYNVAMLAHFDEALFIHKFTDNLVKLKPPNIKLQVSNTTSSIIKILHAFGTKVNLCYSSYLCYRYYICYLC